jgi:two-component system response regulator
MNPFDQVDTLIVEDNPQDAELIVRAMDKQKLGNLRFIVEDGEEALDFIFCRGQYSKRNNLKPLKVIFLDLKLPKVNGLEVLKEIKSNPDTKKLPVVVITSSREDQDIKAAYESGANSYIIKPVDYDSFLLAINNMSSYWLKVNEPPK